MCEKEMVLARLGEVARKDKGAKQIIKLLQSQIIDEVTWEQLDFVLDGVGVCINAIAEENPRSVIDELNALEEIQDIIIENRRPKR